MSALKKIHDRAANTLGGGVHTRSQWASATKSAAAQLRAEGAFLHPAKVKKPPGPIALRHKAERLALRESKAVIKALPNSPQKASLLAKFPEPKHKYVSEQEKAKRKLAYANRSPSKVAADKAKAKARYDKKKALLGK